MSSAKGNFFRLLINRVLCFVTGHPCEPTGRHGYVVREWRCQRCGGLYASHREYGDVLLPVDARLDQIFKDREKIARVSSHHN